MKFAPGASSSWSVSLFLDTKDQLMFGSRTSSFLAPSCQHGQLFYEGHLVPVPVLLYFSILPLSHWSPVARGTVPHSPHDNSSTAPSSERQWVEPCARDGDTDRPRTCYPRWHGPAAIAHSLSQLRLSQATRAWNHPWFWRPTSFFLRFRAFVVLSDSGNLRRFSTVRAPDQQRHGTIRLMKSRVLSQITVHSARGPNMFADTR